MEQNVIITEAARKKLVRARAGAINLPEIVGMAFGSGGADGDGNVVAPAEDQTGLSNELLRKEISGYKFVSDTVCRYECTLSETELSGEYISEIGLYDSDGDIVCVKTFIPKGKDNEVEMTFAIDDIF